LPTAPPPAPGWPQASLIAESFGPATRYSGAGIGYQLASLVAGGPAPLIAAAIVDATNSSTWVSVYIIGGAVVAMIALLGSSAILAEASLSFLGVGDPNVVSLGQMLTSGLEYVTNAWWVPGFPGAAIFVLVLLLNVLGDGLNVALNPRLRRGGV